MATKSKELARECQRQFDNCLYTAASMTLWAKTLGQVRASLVILSLLCGSFASWQIVTKSENDSLRLAGGCAAFLAGLIPTVLAALKLEKTIQQCRRLAGEFTNLRDGFRQAALVHSQKPFGEFEGVFQKLMARMDRARALCVTPPEPIFLWARWKINQRHYSFDIDSTPEPETSEARA